MSGSQPTNGRDETMRVRAGDIIASKYQVERVLAEGGMGVVVAARHTQLGRRVALKFLLPELCKNQEVVARFIREAQAMTAIQNEHVGRVLDVGTTEDGSPYMVMEFLDGEDLSQTIERRGRLPVGEAVSYLLQAMEALAEAHLHGIVHRDLKPSNLFVTQRPDGSPLVKVLDFGISKVAAEGTGGAELTHAQGLLGSPLYMAPEQIRSSKSVDVRADVWALGVILYELLSGHTPFHADTVQGVLAAIVADEAPLLQSVVSDAPAELSVIIARCLRRPRDERFVSVAELATALRPFASRSGLASIEMIERLDAHRTRSSSSSVNLEVKTPPRAIPLSRPPSGFDDTAQISNDPGAAGATKGRGIPSKPNANDSRGGRDPVTSEGESTFGKYKLIAVLGQGGMADVFLAVLAGPEGLGFNKLVVIKRLRANLAHDPEFVAMLIDEARVAARLNHPNVVQTLEVGIIDGEYYIAMEYLDGQPLHRIVQRVRAAGPEVVEIPLAFRLGIVRDLLAGVHHAHELADFDGTSLGLVHRDVSPQNVFVTYDGQIKVVDFGIAKARGRATETAQGTVKGKIAYMAPEQAVGKEVDRRVDVFAAGVILWELLTGERLWKGVDDVAILQRLMLGKIPGGPRDVNAGVPKALDVMVKRALAPKKGDRFESAQAFQLAIERYMEVEGLQCGPRELGEWIARLFESNRRRTRSVIEAQLSAVRAAEPHSLALLESIEGKAGLPGGSGTPAPSSRRLERLDREPVPDGAVSPPGALARTLSEGRGGGARTPSGGRGRSIALGAVLVAVLSIGGFAALRPRTTPPILATGLVDAPPPVTSLGAGEALALPGASVLLPTPATVANETVLLPIAPSASATSRRLPRGPVVRPPTSGETAPAPTPATSSTGRKKRELDDDPYGRK